MKLEPLLFLILAGLPMACHAGDDAASVQREAVTRFLEAETRSLEGRVTIEISEAGLPGERRPCAAPEAFLAAGRRAWGRITVGLRCRSPLWTLYIPARIRVESDYLSAARPLGAGATITEADIRIEHGDIAAQPQGTLTRREQAVGRALRIAVSGGIALRTDQLQPVYAIARGQKVRVLSRGSNFEVSNEGEALAAAVEGQTVQVRLTSGKVVQGIARAAGIVEIPR
ncbi:flagellar basal body P-ring formation chaperone FlgA [Niveibacterium terrae]|uniref:flagellar basal body P-ring formation chaperone FlgA n=1 Tax=Niveibacterium terrae TaxID=3373598 RepID=UPI003A942088